MKKYGVINVLPALVCLCLLLSGCGPEAAIPEVAFGNDTSVLTIDSWRVVGPFRLPEDEQVYTIANENKALAHDWLAEKGGAEAPLRLGGAATDVVIDFDSDRAMMAADGPRAKAPAFLNQVVDFPIPQVSSHMLFGIESDFFKVMYAVTHVVADRDTDAHLMVSGNSPTKIWLNDVVVATSPAGSVGNAQQIQHLVRVRLKAGVNPLVVKLFCFPLLNEFSVRLADERGAQALIRERGGLRDLTDRLVVAPGAALPLTDNLRYFAEAGAVTRYEITAANGLLAASGVVADAATKAEIATTGLAAGFYRLGLYIDEEAYSHPFYVGQAEEIYPAYRKRCAEVDQLVGMDGDACLSLAGLEEIHKEVASKGFRQDWLKKALVYAEMIENGLQRQRTGFRMRSYRSAIDGRQQFYIFYTPESAPAARPMPVVIEVPHNAYGTIVSQDPDALRTGASLRDPYYKAKTQSLVSRDANYLLRLARFCDEYGYACMFPFTRFRQFEDPLAVSDMREALAAMRRDYAIDEERIYLRGFCRGGGNSIRLAENYPDEFAAISTINLNVNPEPFPVAGRNWESINDIRNMVSNLRHVPLQLVHGSHFPHSPVSQSRELQALCRQHGVTATLELFAGDTQWDDRDEYRVSFEFFRDKKRAESPAEIDYATGQLKYPGAWWLRIDRLTQPGLIGRVHAEQQSRGHIALSAENVAALSILRDRLPRANTGARPRVTINGSAADCQGSRILRCVIAPAAAAVGASANALPPLKNGSIEGPVAHALATPFLLVDGSGGSRDFQERARAAADSVQTYWEGKHMVTLQRKFDYELSDAELREMNIVLVGEAGPGSVLQSLVAELPLAVSAAAIKIGDYVHSGGGAAVVLRPNPRFPEHYLVVVNATSGAEFSLPAETADLARYGADVAIWQTGAAAKPTLAGAWLWDNSWNRLIATSGTLP